VHLRHLPVQRACQPRDDRMSAAGPRYPLEGVASWNMNTTCNYRCSYCTQRFVDDRGRASTPGRCRRGRPGPTCRHPWATRCRRGSPRRWAGSRSTPCRRSSSRASSRWWRTVENALSMGFVVASDLRSVGPMPSRSTVSVSSWPSRRRRRRARCCSSS
jgi:hypothetical protein